MKKPKILIISSPLPEYAYLADKYEMICLSSDSKESPFVQADKIIHDLQEKT